MDIVVHAVVIKVFPNQRWSSLLEVPYLFRAPVHTRSTALSHRCTERLIVLFRRPLHVKDNNGIVPIAVTHKLRTSHDGFAGVHAVTQSNGRMKSARCLALAVVRALLVPDLQAMPNY